MELQWKGSKVVRAVITSTLGGNVRFRVPNELQLIKRNRLKGAARCQPKSILSTGGIQDAVTSPQAKVVLPVLKNTLLYDLSTQRGRQHELILK